MAYITVARIPIYGSIRTHDACGLLIDAALLHDVTGFATVIIDPRFENRRTMLVYTEGENPGAATFMNIAFALRDPDTHMPRFQTVFYGFHDRLYTSFTIKE